MQECAHASVVAPWIPTNMGDEYVGVFAGKAQIHWVAVAKGGMINIAVYGAEGPKLFELLGDAQTADVTGVPNFIAFVEVLENIVVEVAMGIREETDAFHVDEQLEA